MLYFALDHDAVARDSQPTLVEAHADLSEAQNLALVRQLDPHFLFNARNTVSGPIEEGDPQGAGRTIPALARMMRETFQRAPPSTRTLDAELAAQSAC